MKVKELTPGDGAPGPKKRGVVNVLVVCVDDLTGYSGVTKEEFPQLIIQKCIVHQVRNSLKYVQDKEKKKVAADLKKIYTHD